MSLADEIQKLDQLRQSGAISEAEYLRAKENLISPPPPPPLVTKAPASESDTKLWCTIIHVSVFTPGLGIIAPLIIWLIKKDEMPAINEHAKNLANAAITEIIAALICIPLVFVFIGIPLIVALAIYGFVTPIIAAIKANQGIAWKYPLAIQFIK